VRDLVDEFLTISAVLQSSALACGGGLGSSQVTASHDARQGWRDNPEDADLVGGEHLPVSPFRSDPW
jgi:hypothetical protein